jgi:hypothetical protein
VLDRLSPNERVAFVLHDSFAVDFATIADVLDCSSASARKLASRARSKVAEERPGVLSADWAVVDAFMTAAREGEFERLLALLAPDAESAADAAAVLTGTPERLTGAFEVARMFNGGATSALPVFVGERPGAAWFLRGEAKVAFDFTVTDGRVSRIDFRADPQVLAGLRRRLDGHER